MGRSTYAVAAFNLGAAMIACSAEIAPVAVQPPSRPIDEFRELAATPPTATKRSMPSVSIRDPALLAQLEIRGLSFGQLVGAGQARTTRELSGDSRIAALFQVLAEDVRQAASGYPLAKVTTIEGFRSFDTRLLSSDESSFQLVGIFPRFDRAFVRSGGCGELRFIYRLRYDTVQGGAEMGGRLPFTANVVFLIPGGSDGCAQAARAFDVGESTSAEAWIGPSGPLSDAARAGLVLWSVETNLQTLRLQSSVSPTLGGNVDYSLRVFRSTDETGPKPNIFVPSPLENTPDLAALTDPVLRTELIAYLRQPEVLRAIDEGVLLLPQKFLATGVHSFAPRGLSRLSNRLYSQVLSEKDLQGLDLSRFTTIGSTGALLRRLDGLTCSGCHQSGSVAGFHFVGDDPSDAPRYASLLSGASTHLAADLLRRKAYAASVAAGEVASEARPAAEQQGHSGRFGAPCTLGDAGFSHLTCAAGLVCQALEDRQLGVCLESEPLGAPCEFGALPPKADPRADYPSPIETRSCGGEGRCSRNISGFAMGACSSRCEGLGESGACAEFLDVDGFQNCLRFAGTHETCAQKHVGGVGLRACDEARACRQDYVCVRTSDAAVGACVPPYFVYPLRLDGRPSL